MKWFPRLAARGHVGLVSPPPFSFDLTSQQYFAAARKKGALKNLVRLRGLEDLQEEAELDAGAALVLASRLTLPAAWCAKTSWSDANGGTAMNYVRERPSFFSSKQGGLLYENDGVAASFISSFTIEDNQPFLLRCFLAEPEEYSEAERDALDLAGLDPRHIWQATFDKWIFRIVDGSFEIARKSLNWTLAKQADLDALLDLENPTEEEQDAIDQLTGPRKVEAGGVSFPDAIYDIQQSLDLGKPVELQETKFYEIYFHPEPRGRLNVQLAGGKPQSVEIPEILASRDVGTVYASTPLGIATSGQTFAWQPGHSAFRPKGSLTIGPFKTGYWTDSMGAAILTAIKDQSLPGTAVTIEHIVHNEVWFSFRVTVTTSNPKYSPFFYGAQANLVGGNRNGSSTIVWDSSTSLDDSGFPPIIDVVPSCEGGPGAAFRRQSYQLIIRDPAGTALADHADEYNCDALENRIVDISAGQSLESQIKIVTTGLVTGAQLNDARRARYNSGGVLQTLRAWLCLKKTRLHLTVSDGWALLDADIMTDSPIGDGMTLGAFLRLLLLNGGWKESEIAGVSALDGRVLPRAALGESPCVRPDRESSRGEYVRSLVEKFGRGWLFWIDQNGVWQFGPRASALKQIGGVAAEFVSSSSRNNAYTWPGRFAILSPLDHIRESEDFYNYFRVEGWVDPTTGQRISDEYIIRESLRKSGIFASLKFLGRLKRYPTLRDDGLRTPDDVHEALMNLVRLYGRSCRALQFTTYFHIGLMPGDLITVDGLLCEVLRISGGSMKADRMQVVCAELDYAL